MGFVPHHQTSAISMVFFHPKPIHFERLGGGRTPNDASGVRRVGSCAKAKKWLGAVQYFMYLGT